MPGVSGKMIRRRIDKSEKERLSRQSCSRSVASSHNYSRVTTEANPSEFSESVHCGQQAELSPRAIVRRQMARDLSAICEEGSNSATVPSTSPLRRALEFCKSVRRLALHST